MPGNMNVVIAFGRNAKKFLITMKDKRNQALRLFRRKAPQDELFLEPVTVDHQMNIRLYSDLPDAAFPHRSRQEHPVAVQRHLELRRKISQKIMAFPCDKIEFHISAVN